MSKPKECNNCPNYGVIKILPTDEGHLTSGSCLCPIAIDLKKQLTEAQALRLVVQNLITNSGPYLGPGYNGREITGYFVTKGLMDELSRSLKNGSGSALLQELAELRFEVKDGDYWMERVKHYQENGNCPMCFGDDEGGHHEGCYILELETELEQLRKVRDAAEKALPALLSHMPNAVGTSDMGKCDICGTLTESGSQHHCKKCAWQLGKELRQALSQAKVGGE